MDPVRRRLFSDYVGMEPHFRNTSSFSPADNQRMYNAEQTQPLGTSDFPLPIRSSSPVADFDGGASPPHGKRDCYPGPILPSGSSPVSAANRKRRRETYTPSLSVETLAKSRKPTPTPVPTGDTTPASYQAYDLSQDPHLARLLGGTSTDDFAAMPAEQIAQEQEIQAEIEQEIQARIEQERMDAEYAQQLQDLFGFEPPAGSGEPPQRTQTYFDSNGRLRRSDPPPHQYLPSQSLPQSDFTFTAPQCSASSSSLGAPKQEKEAPRSAVGSSIHNVVDLSNDDDDDDDDEPLQSIESILNGYKSRGTDAFDPLRNTSSLSTGNFAGMQAGNSPGLHLGNHGSNYTGLEGTNVYMPSYNSGWHPPSASDWAGRMSEYGQNFAGMAKGAWTSASNLLDQHVAGYPSATQSSYGQPASQTLAGPPLIDVESYQGLHPPASSEWYRDQARRTCAGDEALLDRYMDRVSYVTNDPTKTTAEIKDLLENIRPDEDLPEENREDTPAAMVYALMDHQKLGLAWMKSMEEGTNKGGILADDMGLGKTIQALALMVARRSPRPDCKTTLVVAPVALMKQWEKEIKTKVKSDRGYQLSTYTLHGSGRAASWEELRTYDVVLTTYGTLATEMKRRDAIREALRRNPNWRPITKADRLPLLGDECKWYRVILDEAQCIKNRSTKAAHGACALQAQTRFCMSGTPMQNGVTELYSLVHFLRIKPYNDLNRFNMDFTRSLKSTYDEEKKRGMRKLQALLKAILLRRNKKSVIDGKPILDLPERTTESRQAAFSEDEQAFYNALENKVQLQFNKYLKAGTVGRNYSNVLVLLLRLRQACCHPHLIKDYGMSAGAAELPADELLKMAKELAPDAVARIIAQADVECPVCMDVTENATIFVPCGHLTCSECFARITDPAQAIADGDDGGHNLKCPHCRAKISASRVTDYATFKKVHMGDDSAEAELAEELEGPSDSDSDESTDDDGSDLGGFIVDDDQTSDGEGYRKVQTPFERCHKKPAAMGGQRKEGNGKGKAKRKGPKKTLAQLKKESLRNMKARKKYMARLRKTWETSAKIDKTMEILQGIQDGTDGEKTIIFSQFTSLLDLLEIPVYDKGWKYTRYDGSMSATARNDAVVDFQDKPEFKIMLVSLRAGNSGLNLVAASQVIMLDPFWNPYVEEQAIDRAHRIGQLRPVQVHRVLVPGTVEDRILALQEKKRAMIESALDENAGRQVARLGVRELGYLFVSFAQASRLDFIS
ncbi:MAG: hypothetical protein Q9206_002319 [Seirophora lacunosa]